MASAGKKTIRTIRTTVKPGAAKPKAAAPLSSVPHVAAPLVPPVEPPKFVPRDEPKVDPPRQGIAPWKIWASAAAAVLLVFAAIYFGSSKTDTTQLDALKAENAQLKAAKAPAAGAPVVKYGTGKELFAVEGTPAGFTYDGVSDPVKAALCKSKYNGMLVRSDTCRLLENGQRECKDVCRKPDGTTVGTLAWN